MDQFGHSLRFGHIEFDKEDIYDGYIRNQSLTFIGFKTLVSYTESNWFVQFSNVQAF